ncbi:MAG: hypothetical protein R3223_08530 [Longimicrobiales bacterium]|nr:hypothetical protein [Longimicrobiales bacterium]
MKGSARSIATIATSFSNRPGLLTRALLSGALLSASLLAFPAPGLSQEPAPGVEDMAALVAQLDSGSQAFEEGRLQDARRHHLRAVELAPNLTSAWFGLFMVEDSLGNEAAADSALMRVRRISPGAIPPELRDRLPEPRPPDP